MVEDSEAADELRLEQVAYEHDDVSALVAEVQLEYVARYGSPDEGSIDPATFDPPQGVFFVGYLGRLPVAMGAWRRRDDLEALGTRATAEIKRMYTVPAARGRGLARRILGHLEQTARASGVEALVLETGMGQPEAIALYESSGYTRIEPFGHYRDSPLVRCFARRLDAPRRENGP